MSHPKMTDDQALVSRLRNGDRMAFLELIQRHQRLVAHMVGRIIRSVEDREEICQDVFLKVADKISEFNFQSRLSTWIGTIAYRHAINHLRKQKALFSSIDSGESLERMFISRDDVAEELEDKDIEDKVILLVERLPEQYRAVLSLYHLDGLNYAEIGEITGMPEGTVKNYLFRARKLLKEKVKMYLGKEVIK
ncbi:MAG: sigma-70 family RNA polymerase sigma factor [Bacteroidetes bacterium]|nr:sigma-70 family RNA polymerase sigma factor [Bacteroidota bacterium]